MARYRSQTIIRKRRAFERNLLLTSAVMAAVLGPAAYFGLPTGNESVKPPDSAPSQASVAAETSQPSQTASLGWALSPTASMQADKLVFAKAAPAETTSSIPQKPDVVAAVDAPVPAPAAPEARQANLVIPLPVPRPVDLKTARAPEPSPRPAGELVQQRPAPTVAAQTAAPAAAPSFFKRLFGGKPAAQAGTAVASIDPMSTPATSVTAQGTTAVYDISARTVYLPNGEKLEAHSGLGDKLDDPRFVHIRMRGATPPGVYDLTEREQLFHGVRALRMNPVGGSGAIHGRDGILAHTYMLGPNGDSNGCVSFRNYDRFLQAYLRGEVKRLVVVTGRGQDGVPGSLNRIGMAQRSARAT